MKTKTTPAGASTSARQNFNRQIRLGLPPAAVFFALVLALSLATVSAARQTQSPVKVVPVSKEPHHHLKLSNSYVQVFRVLASHGDDIQMHRHEYDMISIQTGPADTTVHYLNAPDRHQVIADGQVRYQLAGLVHSTEINGDQPFRNVTVALVHPQTNKHNLCVAVLAGKPLHCADPQEKTPGLVTQPELETDQTQIVMLTVAPRAEAAETQATHPELVVALDESDVTLKAGKTTRTLKHPGDVAWFDAAGPMLTMTNKGDNPARLVTLLLKPE